MSETHSDPSYHQHTTQILNWPCTCYLREQIPKRLKVVAIWFFSLKVLTQVWWMADWHWWLMIAACRQTLVTHCHLILGNANQQSPTVYHPLSRPPVQPATWPNIHWRIISNSIVNFEPSYGMLSTILAIASIWLSNLPGWRWATITKVALDRLSRSLHSDVCDSDGCRDAVVHSRISGRGNRRFRAVPNQSN